MAFSDAWGQEGKNDGRGTSRAERRRRKAAAAEFTVAIEHHRAGRLNAQRLYRKFLQEASGNPDALHLLGVIAATQGEPNQAIELISKALAIVPNFADAHSNLGNAFRTAGRLADACASYRRAIALRPEFAAAHHNLGLALYEHGHFEAAVESCERAISLDPQSVEAHVSLGKALRRVGRVEAAEILLGRAVQLNAPSAVLQVDLASLLLEQRQFATAATCYQRAIQIDPCLAEAHRGLAACLLATGEIDLAIKCFRDALAVGHNRAPLWNDLGRCFLAQGRFDEAVEAFRRALADDPDLADAYRNLAICQLLPAEGPHIARIAALAARSDLPIEERAAGAFAVAKALDDADRYDEAFAAYDSANRLYRQSRAAVGDRFDAADLARRIDQTIANFTPAFFDNVRTWGNSSEVPVFIVGLPRSGTSLVEQIAASHSCVFGAGELRSIGAAAAELGPVDVPWTQAAVRRVADAQLERLSTLGGTADRVIDKLPDNIFMLGIVATLFPAARIIFCRRDPRDIAVSCFFQKFSAGLLTFSYDLADCGRRIRETQRLAAHWHRVLPQRWIDIEYEALVGDLEGESRRLIEFLGFAWEPACLDFHRTMRSVQTASSWQVRQPLYHRSVGRWRHYKRHLGALGRTRSGRGRIAARDRSVSQTGS
jgi:tetratricopeptide (TPR) repeat protein